MIIAESHESYRRLNQKTKAAITSVFEVPNYAPDQVYDILISRAETALEKYTYSENTIRKIAEASSGNVTLALSLLKSQALKAESHGVNSLDDVEFNFEDDCPNDGLSVDERTLVKILKERKRLPARRL